MHALQSLSVVAAGADLAPAQPGGRTALAFAVPFEDTAEFHLLPEARRNEVTLTLRLLEQLHAARHFVQGSVELGARYGHIRGCAAGSLRAKYYALRDSVSARTPRGDWRVLIKGYKPPTQQPREFVAFIKRLAEENNRSMKAAWRVLLEDLWPSGAVIPGYGTWMEWYARTFPRQPLPRHCPRGLRPAGWSKRNLYRFAPAKGELALVRQGFKAAKRFFPHVHRDTSQLRPLELIVIDDFETDVMAVFNGDGLHRPQICRVGGLLAMDVATRRKLAFGLKPRLERADGTRMAITQRDVRTLIHNIFAEHGLPDYPVTILCENATAAIAPEFELALATLFDGRIRVERTNLIEHRTLRNGFTERGGCPWEKGWIESEFNYLWNEAGALIGYKGSHERLNGPGDLAERIAYTQRLIDQGERKLNLPPEKIAQLRLPFMNVAQAVEAFGQVFRRADERSDHQFVGFETVTEFTLGDGRDPQPWDQLALLPEADQLAAQPVVRPERPVERWMRLSRQHPRRDIPPSVLALLLLTPKKGLVYRNRAVSFAHDKRGYSYVDAAGTVLAGIQEGTEFFGYFDEANPVHLHLCDAQGRYLGTLQRLGGATGAIDIRDKEALAAEAALTRTIQNRALSEVRERHAARDEQLAQDRAHNEAIVAAHRATLPAGGQAAAIAQGVATAAAHQADERRRARRTRTTRSLAEIVEPEAPAPAAAPRSLSDLID